MWIDGSDREIEGYAFYVKGLPNGRGGFHWGMGRKFEFAEDAIQACDLLTSGVLLERVNEMEFA